MTPVRSIAQAGRARRRWVHASPAERRALVREVMADGSLMTAREVARALGVARVEQVRTVLRLLVADGAVVEMGRGWSRPGANGGPAMVYMLEGM